MKTLLLASLMALVMAFGLPVAAPSFDIQAFAQNADNGNGNGDDEFDEGPGPEPPGDIRSARSVGSWCVGQFGYDPQLGRNRTQAEYETAFGPYRWPAGCSNGE